jgi:hypothetical protein
MEFSHLFSILSVMGAVLFFSAGFSFGVLKSGRAHEKEGTNLEQDWATREAELREAALRESAARETAAREEALRESAGREMIVARETSAEIARLKAALSDLETRAGKNGSSLPPASLPPALPDGRGAAPSFQGILARLSKTKGMRAAVLGDAIGLPIASLGDQSESLGGCCGVIFSSSEASGASSSRTSAWLP